MFLETGYERAGAYRSSWGGATAAANSFPMMDVRRRAEDHQRAALDFVLELAGSGNIPVTEKVLACSSLVYADELPVPMFTVDLDMRCLLWNKRAADLTGWAESEVFAMPSFHTALFSNQLNRQKDLEGILKGALEGRNISQEVWTLKTKWGQDMNVSVFASPRTVSMGAVCGAICVIMPRGASGAEQSGWKDAQADEVSHLDYEDYQISNASDSPRGSEDQYLAALEQPASPYSDRGVDAIDMFTDPVNTQSDGEETSVCSQDWCKSCKIEQASLNLAGRGGSGVEPSSVTRARVMVVDPRPRGRKSLTLMLERCGFGVSCACSGTEALWRFEQSKQHSEVFSVIFISLTVARADDYAVVRELRRLEQSESGSTGLITPALIVAVTDLDRWDMTNTEGLKQDDVVAGVGAVITCPSKVQQFRDTLTTLGVPIDHLDFANKSPRVAFNSWSSPLILAR